jgi:hypothetical protein
MGSESCVFETTSDSSGHGLSPAIHSRTRRTENHRSGVIADVKGVVPKLFNFRELAIGIVGRGHETEALTDSAAPGGLNIWLASA